MKPPRPNINAGLPSDEQPPDILSKDVLLAIVLEILPFVGDDALAAPLEQLALALVALVERLEAARLVLSEALTLTHRQNLEIARLKARLADLHHARRSGTMVAI